ncbi:MAG TPA: thioesterase, partial [Chloroflexi bacterium]|nr:thioesterase [Chloroflexota bacterium]
AENRPMDSQPPLRFMTGNLNVRYHKPTPLGPPIELRGQIREIRGRKVVVDIRVMVEGVVTASGEVIAIQIPEHMKLEPENPE